MGAQKAANIAFSNPSPCGSGSSVRLQARQPKWLCRLTQKTPSIKAECRGLAPLIDACDLVMRDESESYYLHQQRITRSAI